MWVPCDKLMKSFDLDETTSFLDHVYLGCTQPECKPNGIVIKEYREMFDTASWQTKKCSNFKNFEVFAWMIINSNKKNLNRCENSHKHARKLPVNA